MSRHNSALLVAALASILDFELAGAALSHDSELAVEARKHLSEVPELAAAPIAVEVRGGRIILRGEVDRDSQKTQALIAAAVDGASSVSADAVVVKRPLIHAGRTAKEVVEEATGRILSDPRIKGTVTVSPNAREDGVRLSGEARDLPSKLAAEDDARMVDGIGAIESTIEVRLRETRPDAGIAEQALMILRNDPDIARFPIEVRADEGAIELQGRVAERWQARQAEDEAARAPGATGIANHLIADPALATPGDDVLLASVHHALDKDPLLTSSDKVRVKVKDGVVYLLGAVDSLTQYYAALRDAFSVGAAGVWANLYLDPLHPVPTLARYFARYPGEAYPLEWNGAAQVIGSAERNPASEASAVPNSKPTPTPRPREDTSPPSASDSAAPNNE